MLQHRKPYSCEVRAYPAFGTRMCTHMCVHMCTKRHRLSHTPRNIRKFIRFPVSTLAKNKLMIRGCRLNRAIHVDYLRSRTAGFSCCLVLARKRIQAVRNQLLQVINLLRGNPHRILQHPPVYSLEAGWFRHRTFISKVVLRITKRSV
jgi:hypothetical protein